MYLLFAYQFSGYEHSSAKDNNLDQLVKRAYSNSPTEIRQENLIGLLELPELGEDMVGTEMST